MFCLTIIPLVLTGSIDNLADPEVLSQYPALNAESLKELSIYSKEELVEICILTLTIMNSNLKKRAELL